MTGIYFLHRFLLTLAVTAFGLCVELDRGRHIPRTPATARRVVGLVVLSLFSIGLGAVFCQIGTAFGLALPLCVGCVPIAVLVRNCSEMAPEDIPDREAGALGLGSLCLAMVLPVG